MILSMIQDTPMNGAEMMEKMESMSIGWWRPSPGSLYPMLSSMVEEGLVVKREDGRYVITQKGIEEISGFGFGLPRQKRISVEGVVGEMENNLAYLEDLPADKVAPFAARIKSVGERAQKVGSRSDKA